MCRPSLSRRSSRLYPCHLPLQTTSRRCRQRERLERSTKHSTNVARWYTSFQSSNVRKFRSEPRHNSQSLLTMSLEGLLRTLPLVQSQRSYRAGCDSIISHAGSNMHLRTRGMCDIMSVASDHVDHGGFLTRSLASNIEKGHHRRPLRWYMGRSGCVRTRHDPGDYALASDITLP